MELTRRSLFGMLAAAPLLAAVAKAGPAPGASEAPTDEEFDAAYRFYAGDQWPSDVAAERRAQNRPCVTFNRLAAAIDAEINKHKIGGDEAQLRQFIVQSVRAGKDSQMRYNYMMTQKIESLMLSSGYEAA